MDKRETDGRHFVCDGCHLAFWLPATQRVGIRFVGRTPEVECPDCHTRRETAAA